MFNNLTCALQEAQNKTKPILHFMHMHEFLFGSALFSVTSHHIADA